MSTMLERDIDSVQKIGAVPTILEAVSEITGLGFVCVARVSADSWHACAVLDKLGFGLKVGGQLDVTTTLCEEVRDTNSAIIIDSVKDSERYCNHHTPRMYGFQSYFSIPLYRPSGEYFGTLCGLDPKSAPLTCTSTRQTLTLFAELISRQLVTEAILQDAKNALGDEVESSKLREQFLAMLGHDIRTPLGTIANGTEILRRTAPPTLVPLLDIMHRSTQRIAALIEDVTDFTRGRMGGGISLNLRAESNLEQVLQQVVDELRANHDGRQVLADFPTALAITCDSSRLAQLFSNLLKNALVHGSAVKPIHVHAKLSNGIFELGVTNSGPKIPLDVQAQLFKPFWQSSNSDVKEGLGLGLFIASEIAVSHGGTLEIASSDAATTFTYRCRTDEFLERRAVERV